MFNIQWKQRYYFFIHLLYIILVAIIGAITLYAVEYDNKKIKVTIIDAIFTGVSAVTITGLFTVDFSSFSTAGQVVTLIVTMAGSLTVSTLPALCIRTWRARKRMLHKRKKLKEDGNTTITTTSTTSTTSASSSTDSSTNKNHYHVHFGAAVQITLPPPASLPPSPSAPDDLSTASVIQAPSPPPPSLPPTQQQTLNADQAVIHVNNLTSSLSTDSISSSVALYHHAGTAPEALPAQRRKYDIPRELPSFDDRQKLYSIYSTKPPPATDIEYLAHVTILLILLLSILLIWSIFFTIIGIWLQTQYTSKELSFVNPWYLSIFLTIGAFNNAGVTPYADNLVRFVQDPMINFNIAFLCIIGNTMFPSMLRVVVVMLYRLPTRYKMVFKYLLDNHHHVTIHLFPSLETRVYSVVTVIIPITGLVFGLALEYNNPAMSQFSLGSKVMIILFHSISTRMSGFNTVDLSSFTPPTLLLFSVMMRIKPQMFCSLDEQAYGITKVERRIREKKKQKEAAVAAAAAVAAGGRPCVRSESMIKFVQEELLDYGDAPTTDDDSADVYSEISAKLPHAPSSIRRMLVSLFSFVKRLFYYSKNLLLKNNNWIGLFIFLMVMSESIRYPYNQTFLRIIFEVFSSFGNVGLSMGYPGLVVSYAGAVSTFSKFCLMWLMLLGRHRGLYGAMKDQEMNDTPAL